MDGDDPKNSNNSVVTSIGNSWVLCRSKSYSGRIYYFNTLTGEAAWNLSNAEVEKAKKITNNLRNQVGGPLEGCPEPKEPPMDSSTHCSVSRMTHQHHLHNYEPSNIFNNQVINTQITKSPFAAQVSQHSNFVPINQVETLGLNINAQPMFNPNIWAIPSTHQIFIAPSSSTITNERHTSLIEYNNFRSIVSPHQTTFPLSRHFSINETRHRHHLRRHMNGYHKFSPKFYNNRFRHNAGQSHTSRFRNKSNDLRQVISAKRSEEKESMESHDAKNNGCNVDNVEPKACSPTQLKYEEEELCASDVDDDWLEVHGHTEGEKIMLDVSPLRKLIIPNTNSDRWYIVVDRGVILNHYKFLNTIINSDEMCQLMIAKELFLKIQRDARADCDKRIKNRARCALRFLSHQFAIGSAVIGEDSNKSSQEKEICLLNFCSKLVEQHNPLIYITHEEIWQQSKLATKVPILTITEIKVLLYTTTCSKEALQIQMPQPFEERSIKITIPNNKMSVELDGEYFPNDKTNEEPNTNNDFLNNEAQESNNNINCLHNDNVVNETVSNGKEIDIQTDNTPVVKKTVDAGVQTDFVSPQVIVEQDIVSINTNPNQILSNMPNGISNTIDSSTNTSKKKIRLKRNMVNEIGDRNPDKKQYKWHKRKKTVPISSAINKNQNLSDNVTCNSKQMDVDKSFSQQLPNELLSKDRLNMYEDSNESSNCGILYRNRSDNVIIDETSNSDIISNTVSNVDSESVHSINTLRPSFNENNDTEVSSVLFEITDLGMEEYLKMRCDEWISRFVQIMEEVLTQVLEQDTRDLHNSMPPPWTIHEATECIKKRFSNSHIINDAASKLSNILFKISDTGGRIGIETKPAEFMEMYSYGVYLVNALQAILDKSEDLQTAAGSLANLLSDIKNLEGHNDSFSDNITEPSCAISQTTFISNQENGDVDNEEAATGTSPKNIEIVSNKRSNSDNLTSNKKLMQDDEEKPKEVTFVRKIDLKDSFLSSLHLKKSKIGKLDTPESQCLNKIEPISNSTNNVSPDLGANKEPRFIRNFTKCSDFEERLKRKFEGPLLELSGLNYSVQYDEDYGMEEEDYSEGDYYDIEDDGDEIDGDFDPTVSPRSLNNVTNLPEYTNKDNRTFKYFSARLMKEIKEASQEVYGFCILERYASNSENDNKTLFQEAGVLLDSKESFIYRDIIASCVDQVEILLESVNVIKDVVK
ncbi:uncharacterized protein LOC131847845 isoform X2 [Achroia grisella]|uniref:uncharacterized protein LOC131847845 isoform X2 n=1 Tax=Achroia grisella TaxID=688607 RepID=UPI0027D1FC79|nr:uncharacterized protein LOC131847845 isoform X2 [Achroia grisella]